MAFASNPTTATDRSLQELMDEALAHQLQQLECQDAGCSSLPQDVFAHMQQSSTQDSGRRLLSASNALDSHDQSDQEDDYHDLDEHFGLQKSVRLQTKAGPRKTRAPELLSRFGGGKDSVFDERTSMLLQQMMHRKQLEEVRERIHTGQDAHMYVATARDSETGRELSYALKIFKTAKKDYSKAKEADPTGRRYDMTFIKKAMRRQLKMWTEREYKHLARAHSCGVAVPAPLFFKEHILVTRFIGDDQQPAPALKDVERLTKAQLAQCYMSILWSVRSLFQVARLVHGNISERTVLYHHEICWLTDFGRAVDRAHDDHEELLLQDLGRVQAFFNSRGLVKATKSTLGLLADDTALAYITSEDVSQILKGYPVLAALLPEF